MKGKVENVVSVLLQEKVAARLSSDFPAHDIQKFLVRQLLNHSDQSIFILAFNKQKNYDYQINSTPAFLAFIKKNKF